MPILPELRKLYTGPAWAQARARILARAGNCCEHCKRPGGKIVQRTYGGFWRRGPRSPWHNRQGEEQDPPPHLRITKSRTQIGIAHLDHDSANQTDDKRLAALCRGCHLIWDAKHHYTTFRRRIAREAGQGALFEVA